MIEVLPAEGCNSLAVDIRESTGRRWLCCAGDLASAVRRARLRARCRRHGQVFSDEAELLAELLRLFEREGRESKHEGGQRAPLHRTRLR